MSMQIYIECKREVTFTVFGEQKTEIETKLIGIDLQLGTAATREVLTSPGPFEDQMRKLNEVLLVKFPQRTETVELFDKSDIFEENPIGTKLEVVTPGADCFNQTQQTIFGLINRGFENFRFIEL